MKLKLWKLLLPLYRPYHRLKGRVLKWPKVEFIEPPKGLDDRLRGHPWPIIILDDPEVDGPNNRALVEKWYKEYIKSKEKKQ